MDAELRTLVQRFQQLQRQEVVHRINERNIVEIVNVIHREKHLVEMLYTVDGKEFVTWDQLRREIVSEIFANHGRMNVVDLPSALNVDLMYIERALPDVLQDSGAGLVLHMGEIMTQQYLDALILDASDQLKEAGSLLITTFAKSYQLSSIYVADLLTAAISEGKLSAQSTDNALYTTVYVHAQRAMLRSALLARTSPTGIYDLAVRHGINTGLLPTLVKQLAPQLPGDADSSTGGQYVPHVFTQERKEQVVNLYRSNGYVSYPSLQAIGILNPKRYMENTFNPPSTSVAAASASNGRARGAKGKRSTAVSDKESDAPVRSSDAFPLAGHALSRCFLADKTLNSVFVLDTLSGGEDAKPIDLAEFLPPDVNLSMDADVLIPRIHELFPATTECTLVGPSTLVHKRVWNRVAPSIATIIGEEMRAARTAMRKADHSKPTPSSKGSARPTAEATDRNPLHSRKLLLYLSKALDLPLDSKQQELDDLLLHWEEPLQKIVSEATEALSQHAHAHLKRRKAELQASCAEQWGELSVLQRGVEWVAKELPSALAAVERSLLQNNCTTLAKGIVLNEAIQYDQDFFEKVEAVASSGTVKAAVALFEKKKQLPFMSLVDALQGASVAKFTDALESLCSTGEISLSCFHALNKKVERELASSLRNAAVAAMEQVAFPSDVAAAGNLFATCCSALAAIRYRHVVHVPGKAIAAVCSKLAADYAGTALCAQLEAGRVTVVNAIASDAQQLTEAQRLELEGLRIAVLAEANGGMGSPQESGRATA